MNIWIMMNSTWKSWAYCGLACAALVSTVIAVYVEAYVAAPVVGFLGFAAARRSSTVEEPGPRRPA
jgi:uncharacterized membrane protein YjjB (DUF3815 family)